MRFLITGALALMLASLLPAALAGDSYYRFVITNKTPNDVYVLPKQPGCATWGQPATARMVPSGASTEYQFYRASHCHGENGQVSFDYNQERPEGTITPDSNIFIDFTADHGLAAFQVGTTGDTLVVKNFQPYGSGDEDLITLDLYAQNWLDIVAATTFGCADGNAQLNAVQKLRTLSDLGSATATKVDIYGHPANSVTNYLVTREIWGFRTLANSMELSRLLNQSVLQSKAQLYLTNPAKPRPDVQAFWENSGPRVQDISSSTALALRLLAISDSAQPRSQFLSVAIDFQTAAVFHGFDSNVYAFRMKPDSPVLGVKNCDLAQSGERQVQVLGGTFVHSILRHAWSPNPSPTQGWESFMPAIAGVPGYWTPYTGQAPVNDLPALTKEAFEYAQQKQHLFARQEETV